MQFSFTEESIEYVMAPRGFFPESLGEVKQSLEKTSLTWQ